MEYILPKPKKVTLSMQKKYSGIYPPGPLFHLCCFYSPIDTFEREPEVEEVTFTDKGINEKAKKLAQFLK